MSKLVVVEFRDRAATNKGVLALAELSTSRDSPLYASAVIAKDTAGKASLQQITAAGVGGVAAGALLGGLAGLAVLATGPLAPPIAAAGGAIIGDSADRIENRDFLKFADNVSRELTPGATAIVAEVAEASLESFVSVMTANGGRVVP
jgi:uncharacterized membrane protein